MDNKKGKCDHIWAKNFISGGYICLGCEKRIKTMPKKGHNINALRMMENARKEGEKNNER